MSILYKRFVNAASEHRKDIMELLNSDIEVLSVSENYEFSVSENDHGE